MTPALLAPLGLIALAAIVVPIAIHLARRTEMRPVDFAAMRWLDARPRPRRKLRLDELPLLTVRILLLALLAVLLARPVLWGVDDTRRVIAFLPGIDAPAPDADTRQLWLAPGFPETDRAPPPYPDNAATLIRRLDAELAPGAPLTIVGPPVLDGMDAERPRLSRRVEWRVADAPPPPAVTPATLPPIAIRHTPAMRGAARYFNAAALVLAAPATTPDIAATAQPLPPDVDHIVWLADGPLPAPLLSRVSDGATLLVPSGALVALDDAPQIIWRDDDGQPLATVQRYERGRVLRLTRTLDPAAMPVLLDAAFPDRLADLMFPAPAPARAAAADHAPLTGAPAWPLPPFDLSAWLALAIAAMFALERWLATRPRRYIAP